MSVINFYCAIFELVRNNLEYFNPLKLVRSLKLLKLHQNYQIYAMSKFDNLHRGYDPNQNLLMDNGFFEKQDVLCEDLVAKLLSNLESENCRYEYSGVQTRELISEDEAPDYRVISVPSSAPGCKELLECIYSPMVLPIENALGCSMRPISIWIYRTYGRNLSSLKSNGDYGSFKFHFDNSGVLNTFKVMCYLSDVNVDENGPLEIVKGTRKLTKRFLPALGGARIPEYFLRKFDHYKWYAHKGDALAFDVKAVHRGGKTTIATRDVVTVELIPSAIDYSQYIKKYGVKGGDHVRGSPYTGLREDPYCNSD